eukprot:1749978-Pyramimonas_sp.AAC.2
MRVSYIGIPQSIVGCPSASSGTIRLEDHMRGFRIVKDATAEFHFDKPGEYILEDDDVWSEDEDEDEV